MYCGLTGMKETRREICSRPTGMETPTLISCLGFLDSIIDNDLQGTPCSWNRRRLEAGRANPRSVLIGGSAVVGVSRKGYGGFEDGPLFASVNCNRIGSPV